MWIFSKKKKIVIKLRWNTLLWNSFTFLKPLYWMKTITGKSNQLITNELAKRRKGETLSPNKKHLTQSHSSKRWKKNEHREQVANKNDTGNEFMVSPPN